MPVLCPTWLTAGRWFVRYQALRRGRRGHLCDLETKPLRRVVSLPACWWSGTPRAARVPIWANPLGTRP